LWPKYNLAQKYRVDEWGIYDYEDRNGYHRFNVNMVTRGSRPLIKFSSKGDAWNFLWKKVHEYELCPKLSGLQLAKGLCFDYQSGDCSGACMGVETTKKYNRRTTKAIKSFTEDGESAVIAGKGRASNEKSIILVDRGAYAGFGFIDRKASIENLDEIKNIVKRGTETPTVQNLVNSYLLNPRGLQIIRF
jgi:DNA polymerase-3 subunit epsilon